MKTKVDVFEKELLRLQGQSSATTSEYIEMMAAAYLKETNIPASEVELVQVIEGYKIRWYFQKRTDEIKH